jgi:hypothetical protein
MKDGTLIASCLHCSEKPLSARTSERQAPSASQFIEFFPPMAAPIAKCALEAESAQGARRRVTMKHVSGDWPPSFGSLHGKGMIQITPQMRSLVAVEPMDGRKGIDLAYAAVPAEAWG